MMAATIRLVYLFGGYTGSAVGVLSVSVVVHGGSLRPVFSFIHKCILDVCPSGRQETFGCRARYQAEDVAAEAEGGDCAFKRVEELRY